MKSEQPNLINDSVLANNIYDLLFHKNRALSVSEIADVILPIQNLEEPLAAKMISIIVANDKRFKQNNDGSWKLSHSKKDKRSLREITYVILDTEIIGTARSPHIVEIAAYRLDQLKITDRFHTFINPGRAVIPKIIEDKFNETEIIIDTNLLEQAPSFSDVLPNFFQFISDHVLVAHNAHFDLRMINMELKRLGNQKLVNRTIDTLKISRKFILGTDTQTLPNLAYYFGTPLQKHHLADEDARVLADIFPHLIQLFEDRDICTFDKINPFLIG